MTDTPSPAAPVLVIDLQTGMLDGAAFPPLVGHEALVANARAVIAWARRTGRKVAFIRHDGSPGEALAPGAAGWPVWPALGQADDEPTFSKSVGDAFSQPLLADWLAGQGASEVVLLGAQTDQCVTQTLKGALERGLKVTVVGDAHGTWDWAGESAAQIVERSNTAFAAAGARVVPTATLTATFDSRVLTQCCQGAGLDQTFNRRPTR